MIRKRKHRRSYPRPITTYDSELQHQTRDPELTKHPDPQLHTKFRDPDELCEEEEAVTVGADERSRHAPQPAWFDSQAWRGSPKE